MKLVKQTPPELMEQILDTLYKNEDLAVFLDLQQEYLKAIGMDSEQAAKILTEEIKENLSAGAIGPPCRVKVWNGDQTEFLGEGMYESDVAVYIIKKEDGSLRSLSNAEERPTDDMLEWGDELVESGYNPRIVLDSGRVVYGCQVWWEPID